LGALSEGAILVILPKKMSRREKALIREKVRRHKDVAEYGQFLIVDNDAFGFNLGMKVVEKLEGVERVHSFIVGRVVFDDELSDRFNQELGVYHGKIPKRFHETTKEKLRKRPGLRKSSRIAKVT
jgi:hypothetical protein